MKFNLFSTMCAFGTIRTIPPDDSLFKQSSSSKLLPMWYPIAFKHQVRPGTILEVKVGDEPFILYLDESHKPAAEIKAMFGICPHQAASFKSGTIERATGQVVCPYHGFRFHNGYFTGITKTASVPKQKRICVPRLPVMTDNDLVYIIPNSTYMVDSNSSLLNLVPPPFKVPEQNDPAFVHFSGSTYIRKDSDVVTENVLDMVHISYVHFFGNKESPLPYQIKYEDLSPTSGRTTFFYRSGPRSLSKLWSKTASVVVENEFYLPSTTVTRVKAGNNLVKTIITRALPVGEDKTLLYWELHRNFWCSDPITEWLGTIFLRSMMHQTLSEDIEILKHVDAKKRLNGFLTIYDKTIEGFRKAKSKHV